MRLFVGFLFRPALLLLEGSRHAVGGARGARTMRRVAELSTGYPQGFTQGGLHIVDYTATLAQRMRRSTPTSFHVRSWCSPATVSAPTVEP